MKKVIVNGASGRLGKVAVNAMDKHPEFTLVAKTGRADNLSQTIKETNADLVIELTNAESVYENSLTIIENGAHPVIGASGLTLKQIDELRAKCVEKNLGGIIAPNFSVGAILMMRFAKMAAEFFPDVEIIETHHEKKIDSPSATALKTAEMIAANRQGEPLAADLKDDKARGLMHQSINVHSLRLPGFIAKQQVVFGALGESLTIESNCIGREAFTHGIVLSCQKVHEQTSLIYGLEELLK